MAMVTKFLTTTSSKLTTINIVDGQIIALSDKNAWFYDMGGVRHSVTGNVINTELPASGETDTLYVVNNQDASKSGVHIWTGTQFVKICGLDNEKVQVKNTENTKVFLVGSVSNVDGAETLVKNIGIFVDMKTGESSIKAASAKSADSAVSDSDGNNINETYIKNVSATKTGNTITFTITKGDDTESTFTVADSDTTYEIFKGVSDTTAGTKGLVPAPAVADKEKFLKADGTWAAPKDTTYSDMAGASESADGAHGLVPKPTRGSTKRFLNAAGQWVVPENTTYQNVKGATASTAGTAGIVPAPAAGDQGKALFGDGTWKQVSDTDTKNTAGAVQKTGKMFLVGADDQTANPQTHTNAKAYIGSDNHLYSNGKQVANLSDAQAFTNKTYEGMTLGNAAAKSVTTEVADSNTNLPTSDAVHAAVQKAIDDAKAYTNTAIGKVSQFNIEVVETLPTTNIDTHTIYLVPGTKTENQNVKSEYLYVNGAWEMIGSTVIDLSGYSTTAQMNKAISDAISQADTGLSVVNGQLCMTYES